MRFHAVYWPAMLLSAGLPLPTEIAGARLPHRRRREDQQVGRYGRRPGRRWSPRTASTRCAGGCCGSVPRVGDTDFTTRAPGGRGPPRTRRRVRQPGQPGGDDGAPVPRRRTVAAAPRPGRGEALLAACADAPDRIDAALAMSRLPGRATSALCAIVDEANRLHRGERARGLWRRRSGPASRTAGRRLDAVLGGCWRRSRCSASNWRRSCPTRRPGSRRSGAEGGRLPYPSRSSVVSADASIPVYGLFVTRPGRPRAGRWRSGRRRWVPGPSRSPATRTTPRCAGRSTGWPWRSRPSTTTRPAPLGHRDRRCRGRDGPADRPGCEGGAEPGDWYVLRAPSGHLLCVVAGSPTGSSSPPTPARSGSPSPPARPVVDDFLRYPKCGPSHKGYDLHFYGDGTVTILSDNLNRYVQTQADGTLHRRPAPVCRTVDKPRSGATL